MDAVVVEDLRKTYGATRAVAGVSFTVRYGEIFSLLGPNGAGKTTVLEILEGYRQADQGKVVVAASIPGDRRTGRQLREQIGLVLQELAVEPYLTVRESISRNAGYYPNPRDVGEVIGLVGLTGKEKSKVKSLSGGQSGGWISPSASSGTPGCFSSTSRRPASTRARGAAPGRSSEGFPAWHHDLAHHPLHGRGAGARQPGRRHLWRQDHRRGNAHHARRARPGPRTDQLALPPVFRGGPSGPGRRPSRPAGSRPTSRSSCCTG